MAALMLNRCPGVIKNINSLFRHHVAMKNYKNCGTSIPICSRWICINQSKGLLSQKRADRYLFMGKLEGPVPSIHRAAPRLYGSESGLSEKDLKKKIDNLTDEFMEARDLLADAVSCK